MPTTELKMQDIIALVGKGKELSRDLSGEEAVAAMRMLMEAQATPYQIGAFLVAVRVKGETADELMAFVETARRYGAPIRVKERESLVDIPVYSGKKRTFHAILPAALVMAAAGVPVLMHGYSEMPGGKTGIAPILQAAGIPTNLEAEQAGSLVNRIGFGYVEISYLHLLLYRYLELRKELGVRTVINTMLRVYNPGEARSHLIGITHPPYMERLAETLLRMGSRRALIFRGVEGESEIPLKPLTGLVELKEGGIAPISLNPKEMGLREAPREGIPGGEAVEQAARIVQILSRNEESEASDAVLLNAGAGIYLSGKAATIEEGVGRARETVETGKAAEKLMEFMQAVREV
jgi:anthranilate phosphoribosyltransferase